MRHDGTTILFGLRRVRVRGVERVAGGMRVVHVLTDDESAAACPACGVLSSSVRQRRTTRPRDLPYGKEALVVRWHKVQFACRERLCARKGHSPSRSPTCRPERGSPAGCASTSRTTSVTGPR